MRTPGFIGNNAAQKTQQTAQGTEPRMPRLTDYPSLVFVLSLITLWLCSQLGAAVRRKQEARGGHAPEAFTIVLTASLTLLGLIVGFTFAMAVSRYDLRKTYEAEEANAIGTAYVRAGLLPASDAAMTRMLLRSYVDQRILLYHARDEDRRAEIRQRITQLQRQLWTSVQNAALAQPSALTALAAAGMNDVLNSQGYTQAAWWNRIPGAAWLLMFLIALLCSVMVGYATSGATVRSLLLLILPLLLSIAFLLIADIDSPRGGAIAVRAQNLTALAETMH
jgi:predicted anti-sigma-YlaC factor YlaD